MLLLVRILRLKRNYFRMTGTMLLLLLIAPLALGQGINRAPHFVHGGDMARLAVSEGTPPGAPVYTLQAEDPEGSKLHYSISGEHFTVDRDTGVVVLRRPLDREAQDIIEVIISITGAYEIDKVFFKTKLTV